MNATKALTIKFFTIKLISFYSEILDISEPANLYIVIAGCNYAWMHGDFFN